MKAYYFLFATVSFLGYAFGTNPENGQRLIKTSAEKPAKWLNNEEIWELIRSNQKFVDITSNPKVEQYSPQTFNIAGSQEFKLIFTHFIST